MSCPLEFFGYGNILILFFSLLIFQMLHMLHHCVVVKEVQSDVNVKTLMDALQKNTDLKLDDFKSMEDVYRYVDAIVSSGSIEEAKGSVFVLGNTSAGKSSLVQTLRNYCKKITKTPKPVLTGAEENKALLETQVLDLVENVQLQPKTLPKLEIKRRNPNDKLGVITVTERPHMEPRQLAEEEVDPEQIETSFVDFGGHTEYASCSPIFIKEKGVFLICFPMSKFKDESALDNEFFSSIGTYLQLVMEKCDTPIIFLVATKGDQVKYSSFEAQFSSVIATAREQLEMIARKSKNKNPFLFDRVFMTSLGQEDAYLKFTLGDLMNNLVAVFGHSELMDVKLKAVPKRWRRIINIWKSRRQQIRIEEAVSEYQQITKADTEWINKAPAEEITDDMEEWKIVAEELVKSAKEESSSDEEEDPTKATDRDIPLETLFSENMDELEASKETEDWKHVEEMFTFFSSHNEIFWFR